jgi:outer membrane immunogenic protein
MVRKYHRRIPSFDVDLPKWFNVSVASEVGKVAMRRGKLFQLLLSCAALTGCLSTSVFAADLSIRRAPVYAPFTWTGIYGGVNLGYGWGDPQITSFAVSTINPGGGATGVTSSAAAGTGNSSRSALGGFQAGYNLQSGSWVYGAETDLSVTKLQSVSPGIGAATRVFGGANTASLQTTSSATASIDWFGTLRARLGFAWDRVLIYGTGGLSFGSVRLTDGAFFNGYAGNGNSPIDGSVAFNSMGTPKNSVVHAGWTAGGGIDYAYTNNVILSFAYLHVDLGRESQFTNYLRPNNILGGASTTLVKGWTLTSTNFNFDVVRAAVSWKL